MEIVVIGRHMDMTPAIKEYASEKASKLPRYFDRVTQIEVVIDRGAANDGKIDVELRVFVERHDPFIVKLDNPDLYAGIDLAVGKMERQLTDHKEKLRNRKHPAA